MRPKVSDVEFDIDGPEACDSERVQPVAGFPVAEGLLDGAKRFVGRGRGNACSRDDIIEIARQDRDAFGPAKFDAGIEHCQRLACAKSRGKERCGYFFASRFSASSIFHAIRSTSELRYCSSAIGSGLNGSPFPEAADSAWSKAALNAEGAIGSSNWQP